MAPRGDRWPTATALAIALAIAGGGPTLARAAVAPAPCTADRCVEVRGQVRRRGDRVPVAAARVLLTA